MSLTVIMTSQETKDLQISLHTALSALSLNQDLGILDDTPSTTSSFTTFSPTHSWNSPPDTTTGITLHISYWGLFAENPLQSAEEGCKKACIIFQYFLNAGKEFDLEDTPCVKMLEDAIIICNNGTSLEATSRLSKAEKVIQKTRHTAPSYTATLRDFVVKEIPIFNC